MVTIFKSVLIILLLSILGCGDPVKSDNNIVKKKITEGLEMFSSNKTFLYKSSITGSLNSQAFIPNEIEYNSTNVIRLENELEMDLESSDTVINCMFIDSVLIIESDLFEHYFQKFTPKLSPIKLNFPLDENKVWKDENWNYELFINNNSIKFDTKEYPIHRIVMQNKISLNYIKEIFFNEDLGIVKAKYFIFEQRQTIDAEIKFDLVL